MRPKRLTTESRIAESSPADQRTEGSHQRMVRAHRDTIIMRCLKSGCPRTKRIERASDISKKVAEIHSYCPWHEGHGWKEYPEIFIDSRGYKLDPLTWERIAKMRHNGGS